MDNIQQFPITREGKDYLVTIGTTADGKSRLYFDTTFGEGDYNFKSRYYWGGLTILANVQDAQGECVHMTARWWKSSLTDDGKVIASSTEYIDTVVNAEDIVSFVLGLGIHILKPLLNGVVRRVLGFNNLPVYSNTGILLEYTEEELSSPPTFDYDN